MGMRPASVPARDLAATTPGAKDAAALLGAPTVYSEFVAKVYDPDFFIAIDYVKEDPVTAIGGMPQNCQLVLKPIPTDAEVEATRDMLSTKGADWKPENNEDFGALFAQAAAVQCKP